VEAVTARRDHGMSAEAIARWRAKWGEGPHVTTDLVVFTLRPMREGAPALSVLLIERGIPPFQGHLALPGGFVQEDEGLETAARRELAEETGVADLGGTIVEQLATFGDPDRDPRGRTVSVVYMALVPWHLLAHAKGADDARAATFCSIASGVPMRDDDTRARLAFDHDEILHVAVERLRGRVTYTTAPFALMPETFTLSELQAAYEAILGAKLHRRAFRERVEREGWVVETGDFRGGAHRPARLFRAATRELLWMRPWPEAAKVPGTLKERD
jgi:8-oxo-dGTP diphosphatase